MNYVENRDDIPRCVFDAVYPMAANAAFSDAEASEAGWRAIADAISAHPRAVGEPLYRAALARIIVAKRKKLRAIRGKN